MADKSQLDYTASALGVPGAWLDHLISFESKWDPKAKNPISGARGLIQFTNTTAKNMGYSDADDLVSKHPDASSQLTGPVLAYLSALKPFNSEQSLYMAVFYPAARNWPLTQEFPALVQSLNPGIKTVADYVSKVNKNFVVTAGISIIAVAAIATAVYFLFIKPKNEEETESWPQKPTELMIPEKQIVMID